MFIRRPALAFYTVVVLVTAPFFTMFILWSGPDLTEEQVLQHKVAELHERLRHAEMLNHERRRDVLTLRNHLSLLLKAGGPPNKEDNRSVHLGRGTLWQETQQLLAHARDEVDIQIPSIHHYLPHLLNSPDSLKPSLKVSKGHSGVTMVLGIPTVKREVQSYLMSTLQNLIENMSPSEKKDTIIIVFIAETDKNFITRKAVEIETHFQEHIDSGLLEILAPSANFYPDWTKLQQTLGDPPERVKWRTKQNLDFAFLMMYAQAKGTFYVQLEDDILTKPGYITTMKNFAYKQITNKKDWLILDFCQLGFIGKMFKCVDLSKLVAFFIMFYNDKPVDWLLDNMVQTKVCRFDKDVKECKKQKDAVWLHYKPSLFQHVGTHSSLKGKVQKLKDKQFGKLALHYAHKNPSAELSTTLKSYKTYNLLRAYRGETFFWGLLPQRGDNISFKFVPPIKIEKFLFRSGNPEHPEDKFFNTTVEVLPVNDPPKQLLPKTRDGYYVVGLFKDTTGISEGVVPLYFGPISTLRLLIRGDSERWAILSEIFIKPLTMSTPEPGKER